MLDRTVQVYVKYLYDSDKYNEWMNPIDYEPEEAVEAGIGDASRAGGAGRIGSRKRQREVPEGAEIIPGRDTVVGEGVTRQEVGTPYPRAMDGTARTQNLSQGQANPAPEALDPLAMPGAVFSRPLTKSKRADSSGPAVTTPKVELVEVHRVPAHASWFRWNKIDDIERRSVPEYFNGRNPSKTPKVPAVACQLVSEIGQEYAGTLRPFLTSLAAVFCCRRTRRHVTSSLIYSARTKQKSSHLRSAGKCWPVM
jgi:hypothetical protein